ncbi:hypothetical protein CRG98_041822 [Punica granatum]|uniref:Integrase catalytic domain-containing protein n=1 Tax=Punica granatum TaxID=22663 RepID=A0A2I0I1F6_PUNGR|nr:hypothetical protein CRG98_041822 [Punica granatum]
MNGAVEATNKNIKKIIEKMTTSTGATPYSLVYGMEAVLPIERYEQLNLIDEKRLKALCHGQCYQQRMARAFNIRVRHREFNPGDLVLRKVLHVTPDSRGKFAYKYDGPFVVKEAFSGGAVILSDMDGTENALLVNADAIKKYYP